MKKLGLTTQDLNEKAVSKAQQRYMAMVAHGKIKGPKGLSKEDARKFAKTKHKGLPDHVDESISHSATADEFHDLLDQVDDAVDGMKHSNAKKMLQHEMHQATVKFERAEDIEDEELAQEAIGELENILRDASTADSRPEYVPKTFKEFFTGELMEGDHETVEDHE